MTRFLYTHLIAPSPTGTGRAAWTAGLGDTPVPAAYAAGMTQFAGVQTMDAAGADPYPMSVLATRGAG